MPLYNELYDKYKDNGLEVIAINVDNPIEDGLDFLLDTPLDFLIPQDPEGDAAELFGVIGMPSSYLVSPDGNIELVHMGFRNGDIDVIEEEKDSLASELTFTKPRADRFLIVILKEPVWMVSPVFWLLTGLITHF